MKFIAHRGLWTQESEKNTLQAFERAVSEGFGIETDVRDCCGRLVISHDMPSGSEISLEDFLDIVASRQVDCTVPLALNVKADGMSVMLSNSLLLRPGLDVFVFDMSVPDMRHYFNVEAPVFTRLSDIEPVPVLVNRASGVWLDCFESDWFSLSHISPLLEAGLRVCVVSPELHGRGYSRMWGMLKKISFSDDLLLCTDFPREARDFFGD